MYNFTYMWNLKNQQMNKQDRTRLIGTEHKLWLPKGRGLGDRLNR